MKLLGDFFGISFNWQKGAKPPKKGGSNFWPLLIFGIFFFIMGGVGTFLLLYLPLQGVIQSRQWKKVDAVILTSQVKSDTMYVGGGGTKGGPVTTTGYSIAITYEYSCNGIRYTGTKYDFFRSDGKSLSSGREAMAEIVRKHSAGSKIVCLVNPDVPDQSVISRAVYYPSLLIGIVPVLLLATAIGFFVVLLKKFIFSTKKGIKK